MAKIVKQAENIWDRNRESMWNILGSSISGLPVRMWEPSMILMRVQNAWWTAKTGSFPAKAPRKGTHPLFVISKKSDGVWVCPCTTKKHSGQYIKKGCKLSKTGKCTDKNSYLLKKFAFSMSNATRFSPQPTLLGIVPQKCIEGAKK